MTRFYAACARALALAVFAAVLAGLSGTAQAQQSGDRHRGILAVVWGDPHKDSTAPGDTQFTIVYPDGNRAVLDVGPELKNEAIQYAGKRVTVRGNASAAEGGRTRIKVESIETPEAGPRTEITGTRKVLFILLRFAGDNQTPHPVNFFKNLTNPMTPSTGIPATINAFFDKVSYGVFKWQATVAGNKWYTLPKTRVQYASCGSNSSCFASVLDDLGHDALALVAGDVNVNDFANINFVFNNDLDCCAWGGTYVNQAGTRSWGATWEPPWGQETGVYVHEMGHSLGLPHSGWRYSAYDSNHDQMSRGNAASSVLCGTYNSVLFGGAGTQLFCDKPGGGFIMAHQHHLGWIPNANRRIHNTIDMKDYTVEANSLALTNRIKMLIICITGKPCSGGNAHFISVEVKLRAGDFDNGIPSEGVVIHEVRKNRPATPATTAGTCFFNNQSGWAMPFDANVGDWAGPPTCSGAGLTNMAYGVGQQFNHNAFGIRVRVISKTGNTFKVRVTKSS